MPAVPQPVLEGRPQQQVAKSVVFAVALQRVAFGDAGILEQVADAVGAQDVGSQIVERAEAKPGYFPSQNANEPLPPVAAR